MKCDKHAMLLYAVTDRAWVGNATLAKQVETALQNGVTCVQLREKTLDEKQFLQEAMEIRKLCTEYHVPFLINDDVEIAIQCHADGVHVGQQDMPVAEVRRLVGDDMMIGVSAHSVREACQAVEDGADYLGVGAVFGSATKKDANNLAKETLKAICQAVDVPVVAIGGICEDNILQLAGSGVDGVAVVSAIFGAKDIAAATARLRSLAEQII